MSLSKTTTTANVIDVYVKLPSGRTSVQHLSKTDLVERIYENVASEERVAVERIRLKYTGKVIKKTDTIGYLGICRETILKGEIISIKDVPIVIKTCEGRNFIVTVKNVDTVSTLKNVIHLKEGIDTSTICLRFGGRLLANPSMSMMDAGVTEEAIIDLVKPSPVADAATADPIKPETAPEETKEAVMNSFTTEGRPVEVVFSFDTTGSMYSCLTEVRSKLREACRRLLRDIPDMRIGLMAQGDYCDEGSPYVLRSVDLTGDVDRLTDFADNVPSTGGGDEPECYEWVLRKAQQLDWSDAAAKALVVIGDCEPHPPSYTDQAISWWTELDVLRGMGVKVYGVQARSSAIVRPFYEELSERTGGCYINFKHFHLITDMFLAVCYKESSPEQLEAYVEEVREEGRMDEETQAMFSQLEEKTTPDSKPQSSRYVKAAWWDHSLDTATSYQFTYGQMCDVWMPYKKPLQIRVPTLTPNVFRSPPSPSKSKKRRKRGCEIM